MRGVDAARQIALGLASNALFWAVTSGATGVAGLWLWDRFGRGPSLQTVVLYGLGAAVAMSLTVQFRSLNPRTTTSEAVASPSTAPKEGSQTDEGPKRRAEVSFSYEPLAPFGWSIFRDEVRPRVNRDFQDPVLLRARIRSYSDEVIEDVRLRIRVQSGSCEFFAHAGAQGLLDYPDRSGTLADHPDRWGPHALVSDQTLLVGDLAPRGEATPALLLTAMYGRPKFLWYLSDATGNIASGQT